MYVQVRGRLHAIFVKRIVPGMNILNMKIAYAALFMTVAAIIAVEMIIPYVKEVGYHTVGIGLKPIWFLGKSNNPRGNLLQQIRFYNFRRTYTGGHRGVKW